MRTRQATPDDADELILLRAVLLHTMGRDDWNDDWREPARRSLVRRLGAAEPTMAAFVVERPAGGGLAACAVGTIEERLGNPHNPEGRVGYVFSVATHPDMRRRGYSRACVEALLEWYRDQGVTAVHLTASPDGEPLYTSLGFTRHPDPAMRVRL
ncbi:N-acetyltransferase [Actinoplanes lobatus]|uniref:N-acetyltransferase n=1 Tax=Actinoplanes lobatus TaxID=113568 RepID=A0A7W7MDC9_9ACTN|nr:GNAT family N-acetyltransferase [Actinoplanes lobatus]MBB4746074.1 GNAT superfamily N-acetyltransferase [Actinoplanes lobatus]GGN83661.1 N-acetyltransferase [Actinoplanes lobatus]GIE42411.1 N-acetyltransferase [Actinoplanes lobatus]